MRQESWVCKSRIGKEPTNALTVALKARGCFFARGNEHCRFCGFWRFAEKNPKELGPEKMAGKLTSAISKHSLREEGVDELRIYNGGSFLSNAEITPDERRAILSAVGGFEFSKLFVESRPGCITKGKIREAKGILANMELEVAIGLETADDELRAWLGKGFGRVNFERAVSILAEYDAVAGAYVLIKPCQMSEKEAITDALSTLEYLAQLGKKLGARICARLEPFTFYKGMNTSPGHTSPEFSTILEIIKNAPDNLELFLGWSQAEVKLAADVKKGFHVRMVKIKPLVDKFNSTGNRKVFEKLY